MNIVVMNPAFVWIKTIDAYKSLIWTVRYTAAGDFELYVPLDISLFEYLKKDNYLHIADSDRIMIIEEIKIITSESDGKFIVVSGRSLESLLMRRIVWKNTVLSGNLQSEIHRLIKENIISPSDTSRTIHNFIFEESKDPIITEKTIEAQYHGEELYEVIQQLCVNEDLGFRITLTDDLKFKFNLFAGVNRSYSQTKVPYVIFSPEFENLINSTYVSTSVNYKTITLIGGEGEGSEQVTTSQAIEGGAGIDIQRREMFTDASDVSTNVNGVEIGYSKYLEHLREKGVDSLSNNRLKKDFESSADVSKTFKYGEHFDIGDIVQMRTELDIEAVARVSEIIFTMDSEGYNTYPTFEVVQKEVL